MKTQVSLFALLLLLASVQIEARTPRRGNETREFPGQWMIERLDLTPQQVDTLRTIDADFIQQRDAVRKECPDRDAVRKSVQELRDKRDEAIRGVLTTEQQQAWEELRKERPHRRQR